MHNIIFLLPSLARAGAETQVMDIVGRIRSDILHSDVAIYHKNIDQLFKISTRSKIYFLFRTKKFDFIPLFFLASILNRSSIDAIHCTGESSMLFAFLARFISKNKPKIILTLHTTNHLTIKEKIICHVIYRFFFKYCYKIVFVCLNQRNTWVNKFTTMICNSEIIYNGVDVLHFNPFNYIDAAKLLRKELCLSDEVTVFACIAAFRPEKGHELLVEAFSKIGGNSVLLLAGVGEAQLKIQKLVKGKGLEHRVLFLGLLQDVRPLLALSDVTILASIAVETFSLAMLESMSMETPVIATDIGGANEAVLHEKTGWLVAPGDIQGLVRIMMAIDKDRNCCRRFGKNARKHVVENFSIENMIYKTEEMLINVCSSV